MVGQILGGLTGIAQGAIGGRRRRRDQARAQKDLSRRKAQFENLDTSNVYANMENTMEDLTVDQRAAQFRAEQQNQGLANTMDALQGAAGGSGIAALAQSMAGQQAQNMRTLSADIGQQERANQAAAAQQAGNLQLYEAKGELISRDAEMEKTSTLMGMAQQDLAAANLAREEATQAMVGGIGQVAGAVGNAITGMPSMGGSGGTFIQNLTGNA